MTSAMFKGSRPHPALSRSGHNGRASLKVWTLGDLLTNPIREREHLLEPLIREGESMMLWAAPGVGKTMAALSMALAIAGGGKFLEWNAPKARRVLYVDGEMHMGDLQSRLASLVKAVPGIELEAAGDNLALLARQAQDPEAEFPDLATKEGQDLIFKKATTGNFALVILDNFSVLADVDDENDAAAMSPVLQFLMRMKQGNVATVLLHHSSKGGDNYRGSSKLATTFEVIVGLTAAKGVESRHSSAFDMAFGKFRGKRNKTIEETTAWLIDAKEGALEWQWKASEDGQLRKLVDAVKSCNYSSQKELAAALGTNPTAITRMKGKATAKDMISDRDWEKCLDVAREAGGAPEATRLGDPEAVDDDTSQF